MQGQTRRHKAGPAGTARTPCSNPNPLRSLLQQCIAVGTDTACPGGLKLLASRHVDQVMCVWYDMMSISAFVIVMVQ